jgi:hypothetical protein
MRTVGPPRVLNIADLRRVAKLRLPRVVFDYIDGALNKNSPCARTLARMT